MAAQTCRCGRGKMSAYDGKCGHCRTRLEHNIHSRMLDGWPKEAAKRGYLTLDEKTAMQFKDLTRA